MFWWKSDLKKTGKYKNQIYTITNTENWTIKIVLLYFYIAFTFLNNPDVSMFEKTSNFVDVKNRYFYQLLDITYSSALSLAYCMTYTIAPQLPGPWILCLLAYLDFWSSDEH